MADEGHAPHGRADLLRDLQVGESQCTARSKRTGQRCKRASSLGSNVCRAHGSEAPQTKAKAQRRLQQASDVLVQRLLQFALDGNVEDATALRAIRDALDRAGLGAAHAVDVNVKPAAPFELILEGLIGGSRSEYRASVGRLDPEPLPEPERSRQHLSLAHTEPDDDVIDVEAFTVESSLESDGDDEHRAEEHGRETLANSGQLALPPGYLTTEDALAQARAANARRCETRRR